MRTERAERLGARLLSWFCEKCWKRIDSQQHEVGIQLDVTNACNLACVHCYHTHHKNAGALSLDQWIQVLDQFDALVQKLHMRPRFTICGGEPLTCPFLFPLLEEIRRRHAQCSILLLSNGTLVTETVARHLSALGIVVQISVDGPDAPRHDLIRGQGTFVKALQGCRSLRDNNVPFHHLAVLSVRTVWWVPDFFLLAQHTGARAMHFVRLVVEGQAKKLVSNNCDAPLYGMELKHAMSTILACSRSRHIPTLTRGALWHLIEDGLGSPDNVGMSGMVIGYRGAFKVSSRTPLVLGNVLEDGLERLFLRHPVMQKLRRGEIEGCGTCPHFRKCRGERNASFAAHGHFFGPDPGCWVLPHMAACGDMRTAANQ